MKRLLKFACIGAGLISSFCTMNIPAFSYDQYLPRMPAAFAKDQCSPSYKANFEIWNAFVNQEYDATRDALKKEAEKNPDSQFVLLMRIYIEYFEGNMTVAMPMVEDALKKYPGSQEFLTLQAMILCNDQHPEQAVEIYTQLMSQDRDNAELLRLRANAYMTMFMLDEAKVDIEKALSLEPGWANLLHSRGRIAFHEGRFKEAIADYGEALKDEKDPNHGQVLEDRSEAYSRLHNFVKAKEDMEAADKVTYFDMSDCFKSLDEARIEYVKREKNTARQFMIAVGFPLALQNKIGCLTVSGKPLNEENQKSALELIQSIYGFTEKKQVLAVIWQLSGGAGNDEWREMWSERVSLKGTNEQIRRQLLESHQLSSWAKIDLVMKYGEELGERGVLGYDLGRSTNLCRDAVRAGILTEREGLEIMLYNAMQLQANYSDWKQYFREYLIGRQFWNPDVQNLEKASMQLDANPYLQNADSFLNQIPWNTKLGPETAFPGEKQAPYGQCK